MIPKEQYKKRLNNIIRNDTIYPEDIRYLMKIRGVSQKEVADEIGYHNGRSAVTEVISGDRKSPHIRHVIAKKLGVCNSIWSKLE